MVGVFLMSDSKKKSDQSRIKDKTDISQQVNGLAAAPAKIFSESVEKLDFLSKDAQETLSNNIMGVKPEGQEKNLDEYVLLNNIQSYLSYFLIINSPEPSQLTSSSFLSLDFASKDVQETLSNNIMGVKPEGQEKTPDESVLLDNIQSHLSDFLAINLSESSQLNSFLSLVCAIYTIKPNFLKEEIDYFVEVIYTHFPHLIDKSEAMVNYLAEVIYTYLPSLTDQPIGAKLFDDIKSTIGNQPNMPTYTKSDEEISSHALQNPLIESAESNQAVDTFVFPEDIGLLDRFRIVCADEAVYGPRRGGASGFAHILGEEFDREFEKRMNSKEVLETFFAQFDIGSERDYILEGGSLDQKEEFLNQKLNSNLETDGFDFIGECYEGYDCENEEL
jgi:hypothetical protein